MNTKIPFIISILYFSQVGGKKNVT